MAASDEPNKSKAFEEWIRIISNQGQFDGPTLFQNETLGLTTTPSSQPPDNEVYRSLQQHRSRARYRAGHGGRDPAIDLSGLQLGKAGADEVLAKFAPSATETQKNNIRSFLDTIAYSEGTLRKGDNGYNVQVGGRLVDSEQHPRTVVDLGYDKAGRRLRSSAYGRYQYLSSTWDELKDKLKLPDMGHNSQDAGAIELIRRNGALQDVMDGRFDVAAHKVRGTWASFPGAGYAQHENSMNSLRQFFAKAGGTLEGRQPGMVAAVNPSTSFNPAVASSFIASNAAPGPTGWCAKAVRAGLTAGGIDTSQIYLPNAASYTPEVMADIGFQSVTNSNYKPKVGDIAVFTGPAHPDGHIGLYTENGTWMSDFDHGGMRDPFSGLKDPRYEFAIYRHKDQLDKLPLPANVASAEPVSNSEKPNSAEPAGPAQRPPYPTAKIEASDAVGTKLAANTDAPQPSGVKPKANALEEAGIKPLGVAPKPNAMG